MKKTLAWAGWGVAIVAVVAAGAFFVWGQRNAGQLAAVEGRLADTNQTLKQLSTDLEDSRLRMERLSRDMDNLETKVKPGGKVPESAPVAATKPAVTPKPAPPKEPEAPGTSAPEPVAAAPAAPAASQSAAPAFNAETAVNTQYGTFFAQAGLPPDVEEQVREILVRHLGQQYALALDALGRQAPTEEYLGLRNQDEAGLRAELSAVLTPQDAQAWIDYRTMLPIQALNRAVDASLSQYAPSLPADQREAARQVIVEELLPTGAGEEKLGIPVGTDIQALTVDRQTACENARLRLVQMLDPAIMDQVYASLTRLAQPAPLPRP